MKERGMFIKYDLVRVINRDGLYRLHATIRDVDDEYCYLVENLSRNCLLCDSYSHRMLIFDFDIDEKDIFKFFYYNIKFVDDNAPPIVQRSINRNSLLVNSINNWYSIEI